MKTLKPDFKKKENPKTETYYDLQDDFPLIEASFLAKYKIRLRKTTDMSWDEFCTYLSGLDGDTPLGRIVAIRSEKDPKVISKMTAEEKRIRNEWQKKMLHEVENDKAKQDELYQQMVAMCQGLKAAFS